MNQLTILLAFVAVLCAATITQAPVAGTAATQAPVAGTATKAPVAGTPTQGCQPGTFTSTDGSCVGCSPGSFSSQIGSRACSPCQVGQFTNVSSSSKCMPCPPGTTTNVTGSIQCTSTPAGTATTKAPVAGTATTKAPVAGTATTKAPVTAATKAPVTSPTYIVVPPGSRVGLKITLDSPKAATAAEVKAITAALPGLLKIAFALPDLQKPIKDAGLEPADVEKYFAVLSIDTNYDAATKKLIYLASVPDFPTEQFVKIVPLLSSQDVVDKVNLIGLSMVPLCPPGTTANTDCKVTELGAFVGTASPTASPTEALPNSATRAASWGFAATVGGLLLA